jgi:hypothetical protein
MRKASALFVVLASACAPVMSYDHLDSAWDKRVSANVRDDLVAIAPGIEVLLNPVMMARGQDGKTRIKDPSGGPLLLGIPGAPTIPCSSVSATSGGVRLPFDSTGAVPSVNGPRPTASQETDQSRPLRRVAQDLIAPESAGESRMPPMYFQIFMQMKKQLGQLDKWLEAAAAFAEVKKFDSKNFLDLRLVVDQFNFARQIQVTCDTAKLGASRLTGRDAPSHADDETTLDALRARVKSTMSYLDGFTAKDFDAAATRTVTQPRWEGRTMTGHDYFVEHVTPNFFFHLTTSYAILRQNGVSVGKRDYLGALTQHPPKA